VANVSFRISRSIRAITVIVHQILAGTTPPAQILPIFGILGKMKSAGHSEKIAESTPAIIGFGETSGMCKK
jgi:hypothetical protein